MNTRFVETLKKLAPKPDLKVAVVQMKPCLGNKLYNLSLIEKFLSIAKQAGADLVVFPEMCLTGYIFPDFPTAEKLAEQREGPSFEQLAGWAKKHGLWVVYGFPEKLGRNLYNAQNLIGPTGKRLTTYQKTHLFYADCIWARPGTTGYVCCPTDLGRLGLGICMDMNFQDFLYFHRAAASDLVAVSNYWLKDSFLNPVSYWCARWSLFQGAVAIANAYGEEGGYEFSGHSCILYNNSALAVVEKNADLVLASAMPQEEGAKSLLSFVSKTISS